MSEITIEESVRRIKQTVEWFPGVTLPCRRQSGKTTAILEMIHELHGGRAAYLSHSRHQAFMAKSLYLRLWTHGEIPLFTSDPLELRGQSLLVYVDEFWMLSTKTLNGLDSCESRIVCRLGTRL